jgi:DNA-binding MarR family transcriptional regulator
MVMSSKGLMGFPVNSSQLKAMAAFHEDRRYSMGELCKIANVKMPSMTEVVDRLEKEGFVERVRDSEDRRVVRVQLTSSGRKAHDQILKTREQELFNIFGILDDMEREKFLKALQTASKTMKKVAGKYNAPEGS